MVTLTVFDDSISGVARIDQEAKPTAKPCGNVFVSSRTRPRKSEPVKRASERLEAPRSFAFFHSTDHLNVDFRRDLTRDFQ